MYLVDMNKDNQCFYLLHLIYFHIFRLDIGNNLNFRRILILTMYTCKTTSVFCFCTSNISKCTFRTAGTSIVFRTSACNFPVCSRNRYYCNQFLLFQHLQYFHRYQMNNFLHPLNVLVARNCIPYLPAIQF